MKLFEPVHTFVAFDLETTGLECGVDDIIEIGAVKVQEGRITDTFDCLVRCDRQLSYLVQSLTGLTESDMAGAVPLEEALAGFAAFAGSLPLVAHNADFDTAFLAEACRRAALPVCENPVYDSLLMARMAWPTQLNHRLETLVENLRIPPLRAHRALPDAEKAARLWLLSQERMAGFNPRTLSNIHHILKDGDSPWKQLFPGAACPPSLNRDRTYVEHERAETGEEMAGPDATAESLAGPDATAESLFSADSPLAGILEGFVPRQAQAQAARLVEQALEKGGVLALDTEPGLGHSLAFLVPAALCALRQGSRVLVCVAAHRGESIDRREFALLARLFGPALRLAALQPPENYVSSRKYLDLVRETSSRLNNAERLAFLPVVTWMENTRTGSISENHGFSHERNRVLWMKLCAQGYGPEAAEGDAAGFAHAAKAAAEGCHLLFIGHELFLRDLRQDFAFLAPLEKVIFDEADRLPEAASRLLGRPIRFFRLRNLLQVLAGGKEEGPGLLRALEDRHRAEGTADEAETSALARVRELLSQPEKQLQKFFNKLAKQGRRLKQEGEIKLRYAGRLALDFNAPADGVLEALGSLSDAVAGLAAILRKNARAADGRRELADDLETAHARLRELAGDLAHLAQAGRDDEVFWMEDFLNPHRIVLRCAPRAPGEMLARAFYPLVDSAVFLSSAIDAGDGLRYFLESVGAVQEGLSVKARVMRNSKEAAGSLLLARFCPHPARKSEGPAVDPMLSRLLPAVPGRVVVYFTGLQSLRRCQKELLQGAPAGNGRVVLAQHVDGGPENILHLARQSGQSCILATAGIADDLSQPCPAHLVVIAKLPFPVPGDPLVAARVEQLKEQGRNVVTDLLLPEAVLRLKHMLKGIAPQDGRQVIWVMDPRLGAEKYARAFQKALPFFWEPMDDESSLLARTLALLDAEPAPNPPLKQPGEPHLVD